MNLLSFNSNVLGPLAVGFDDCTPFPALEVHLVSAQLSLVRPRHAEELRSRIRKLLTPQSYNNRGLPTAALRQKSSAAALFNLFFATFFKFVYS